MARDSQTGAGYPARCPDCGERTFGHDSDEGNEYALCDEAEGYKRERITDTQIGGRLNKYLKEYQAESRYDNHEHEPGHNFGCEACEDEVGLVLIVLRGEGLL